MALRRLQRTIAASVGAAISVMLLAPVATSAGDGPISTAEALVRGGFPELAGPEFDVVVTFRTGLGRDWNRSYLLGVTVSPADERSLPPRTIEEHEAQFLASFIDVDPDGSIFLAHFRGRHVHSREMRVLQEAAVSHPGWTEADIARELTKLGAKYGPNERADLLLDLDLKRFEIALGSIRHADVNFSWFHEVDEKRKFTEPAWTVDVETELDSRRLCYSMNFEPISGHLTGVVSYRCRSV